MFWIVLFLLTLVINKLLLKIVEPYKKQIILPVALQIAYILSPFPLFFFISWLGFIVPYNSDPLDSVRIVLLVAGLVWLYQKPSYLPVVFLTLLHVIHSIMQYHYLLPDLEYFFSDYQDYQAQIARTYLSHTIFRIIVIWLMFSRLKKFHYNEVA